MTTAGLLIAFVSGTALGGLYFSLLWLSVKKLTHKGSLWVFTAATFARFILMLGALYLFFAVAHGTLPQLGAACLGFLAARLAATRFPSQDPAEN